MIFVCMVCGADDCRKELTYEVFNIGGRHDLVDGVQCTVCARCGEQSFSRETAERVRPMLNGEAEPTRSISMQVYEIVA